MQQASTLTIYKASAGSGKTFTLAVEYIKLLILGGEQEFERTLAVTFTNKATAEMKDRILEQLYGVGHGLKDSEGYLKAIQEKLAEMNVHIEDDEIRVRCRNALTAILHNYSRFTVQTIDAFFQSVLRNLAHELNLTARLQVDIDDKEILNRAVDNLIDGLQPGTKLLQWVKAYTKSHITDTGNWDIRADVKSFAKCIFDESYMQHADATESEEVREVRIKDFLQTLKELRREEFKLVGQGVKAVREVLGDEASNHISYYNSLDGALTKMEADDLKVTMLDRFVDCMDDPMRLLKAASRSKVSADTAAAWAQAIDTMTELWNTYRHTASSVELAIRYMNPLRLVGNIDEEVGRVTTDANRFVLAKTPILLSKLVERNDAPFVFEKMGTRFDNVMIDEFQDTSNMQWQNFRVLLMENQAQGGHDLLVGDIKQSIYRWRNGDWHILQNIEQTMSHMQVKSRSLTRNFRSQKHIIDFNNAFFPLAARLLDEVSSPDDKTIRTIYADVCQDTKPGIGEKGYVRVFVERVEEKPKTKGKKNAAADGASEAETQAEKFDFESHMLDDMCRQVQFLHDEQHVAYNEMAIILRKKKHAAPIIEHFAQHLPDVRLVSDEAFLLGSSTAVNMIVEAMRYLHDKTENRVALTYLMMHYIHEVRHIEVVDPSAFCLAQPESILPEDFFQRRTELAFMPVYELAEEIYRLFSLAEIKRQEAYLFAFFDELNSYLRDNPTDLHSFLNYWDEVMSQHAIPSGEVTGIRIFTIHKSKGLQFHTVFMPYVNFSLEMDLNDEVMWFEPPTAPYNALGLLPVTPSSRMQGTVFRDDYLEEHRQRRIDELNALYVAFTRAEKNLYVWGSNITELRKEKDGVYSFPGTAGSIVGQVLPLMTEATDALDLRTTEDTHHLLYELGTPMTGEPKEGGEEAANEPKEENPLNPRRMPISVAMQSFNTHLNFRQSNDSQRFLRGGSDEVSETQSYYIEQGKLLHDIFSHIYRATDLEAILRQYLGQGIIASPQECTTIRNLLQRALSSPRVRPWFDGSYTIFNECEIVHLDTEGKCVRRRPDRVMMNDREIIVVDFKFGRPNLDYEDQVRQYMQLMQQMYPHHDVQGVLWYVYRNEFYDVSHEL